jgi:hypothetical protein
MLKQARPSRLRDWGESQGAYSDESLSYFVILRWFLDFVLETVRLYLKS